MSKPLHYIHGLFSVMITIKYDVPPKIFLDIMIYYFNNANTVSYGKNISVLRLELLFNLYYYFSLTIFSLFKEILSYYEIQKFKL